MYSLALIIFVVSEKKTFEHFSTFIQDSSLFRVWFRQVYTYRILVYSRFGLDRILVYSGFGLDMFNSNV